MLSESDEELEEVELLSSESEFVDSRWFSIALTIPVTMGSLRICPKGKTSIFFCWRLLGLIPGRAPFSQLSRGVKDAMVVSTIGFFVWMLHGSTKVVVRAVALLSAKTK